MKGENEKGKEKMTLTAPACKALINLTKPSIVPESYLEICTAKLLAQVTQPVYLDSELNFKNKNKQTKSNQQKKARIRMADLTLCQCLSYSQISC